MNRKLAVILMLFAFSTGLTIIAQDPAPEVKKGSIPPNFSHYTLNPNPPATILGWAEKRIEEKFHRSVLALRNGENSVYLSWRLLKSDPPATTFNVYRTTDGGAAVKVNSSPILKTTDFQDSNAPLNRENSWFVRALVDGKEQEPSIRAFLPANSPVRQYKSIKIRDDIPATSIDRIGIGDLDGDGEYDFVIKRPGGTIDPSFTTRASPDTFKIEAYKSDGTFLWRKDLGWSIQLGIWFSPFYVYDLDGDGQAEIAIKTSEGDHRDKNGQVLSGPEYLSIWNGETGEEIARTDWIPRGKPSDWGDYSGNRMNRHLMGLAYLDGKTPSVVTFRGTYGLMKAEAFFLKDKQLHKVWSWTNEFAGWRYQGQGQHAVHIADIDGDGFDEVLNGSIAINNNGQLIWSTGNGHGDRFYITDIDPDRRGLEIWYSYEDPQPRNGIGLWDARTGDLIFGTDEEVKDNQIARALVGDIDPAYPGMECWGDKFFYTSKGERILGAVPPTDGLVWWDADLLREIHSRGTVSKWKGPVLTQGIQGRHMLWGDILGDWREEIVTFTDGEVRIYSTIVPAADRRVTLMQDPLYRIDVGLIVQGYPHVPMTSYYLGTK